MFQSSSSIPCHAFPTLRPEVRYSAAAPPQALHDAGGGTHAPLFRPVFRTGDLQGMNGMQASGDNYNQEGTAIPGRIGRVGCYSPEERKERNVRPDPSWVRLANSDRTGSKRAGGKESPTRNSCLVGEGVPSLHPIPWLIGAWGGRSVSLPWQPLCPRLRRRHLR